MGQLRDRMAQDLKLRKLSPSTSKVYLLYARKFARHYRRSPAELGERDIRSYLMHLIEVELVLTWIALLRGRVHTTFAATTGVRSAEDAIKLLLAGADAIMIASSLYINGIDHLEKIEEGARTWLFDHGYESVEQMKGSLSQEHCPDPVSYERVGYMKTLTSFSGEGV